MTTEEKIDFLLKMNELYSQTIKSESEMRMQILDRLKEQYDYILELQSKLENK